MEEEEEKEEGQYQGKSHDMSHDFTDPPGGGVPVWVVVSLLRTLVSVSIAVLVLTSVPGSLSPQVLCTEHTPQSCTHRICHTCILPYTYTAIHSCCHTYVYNHSKE